MLKISGIPSFLFLLLFFAADFSFAQRSLKFESGGGPAGNGPTTTPKVVTFYNGDAGVYSPATTVTYSISNQQYTTIEGSTTVPGLVFGGNNSTTNTPAGISHYMLMSTLGGSGNTHYSTNGATPAIAVANDYSIEIAGFSDALINANGTNKVAVTAKDVYFADLTLSFNRPVTNPVIHVTGLGGTANAANGNAQGISMRMQLVTAGYTVSKLAGNFAFSVMNGSTIYNSSPVYAAATNTSSPSGASGSVLVTGSDISTLTFRVAMDGDGGGNTWSVTNRTGADGFLVSVSLTTYTLSGSVLNDANGLSDNTVNGTGTNAGGLNAVLVDPSTGNVVATVPVNANGTYSFTNSVLAGNYSLLITTETATVGNQAPAVALPDGWVAAGENLGSGAGSDGTPDGILTGISVTGNTSNANFALQRPPVTNNAAQTIETPGSGAIPQGTITAAVSGNDPEDGALGNGNTVVITELPANGRLYYNGVEITEPGNVFENFDPALLSFTDLQDGSTATSFRYSFGDAAGMQSETPGTFTISWEGALPAVFGPVTAQIANGELVVSWTTLTETNNDRFEIEVSRDGKNFISIGTVKSKALNGNSDSELNYSFSTDAGRAATALAGIGLLGVAMVVLMGCRRWNRLLGVALMITGSGLFMVSCKKADTPTTEADKLFVRILQVDKDGGKQTSKVIQVVKK